MVCLSCVSCFSVRVNCYVCDNHVCMSMCLSYLGVSVSVSVCVCLNCPCLLNVCSLVCLCAICDTYFVIDAFLLTYLPICLPACLIACGLSEDTRGFLGGLRASVGCGGFKGPPWLGVGAGGAKPPGWDGRVHGCRHCLALQLTAWEGKGSKVAC